ncbi:hypothetical protein BO94DRAFT_538143 [Aspergillus sclerotioniger CBS 115572]|uniref:Uncharacterized protein n=1 Tax=Aspergillus sclerotioniger CBS 115572 TaxID=1450535 RepID=A0A317VSG2_9EURO|nr:hypothetical protein BO94DRAFT_538143 [Aspergillus sclerotioniger CBS 115572]PWY77276.1 hypothetical protein BO94DRAFT_538143 [Aspergillus sclerotioniger CBS 115572]
MNHPTNEAPIPTHAISINIYGRGDATLNDGPSHMGIAIYELGASTCTMHHIRNPTDADFIYDPREQPLEDDPVLRGRCELVSFLGEESSRVNNLLSSFGNDASNIPEFGVGNRQDWVAGAVGMLEGAGVVRTGEGEFWRKMINRSAEGMKEACVGSGRKWVDGMELVFEGKADARFVDGRDGVGRLSDNVALRERMQLLTGTMEEGKEKGGSERPVYVSSPFFSRSNGGV